ncbi:hypothetical protein V490_00844 [Pseudogymnoascus sp. VKM F-3557]|nr:hypothetical protein V490_00844 [Pseudogymnoascus sp. VKM F-3557]
MSASGVDKEPLGADLSNWQTSPFSRWAFHNVQKLIPSAPIEEQADFPLERLPELLSFDKFKLQLPNGSSLNMQGFLSATNTDGLIILFNGRIAYEFYNNGNAENTPHILMSASKALIGLLVGVLQKKCLDVGALVSTYVPEVAHTAFEKATVRDLLDMQVGVRLDDHEEQAYRVATNWIPPTTDEAPTGLHNFFANMKAPYTAHDGSFNYVSANTDLLGWVIERATGESLPSVLSEMLWKPLGAEDRAFITVDRAKSPHPSGGMCVTLRDFARIGQLVLENGYRGSSEVVPSSWISDIIEGGDCDAWNRGPWAAGFSRIYRQMRYRSGWYVVDDEPICLFAMGVHGQNLFVDQVNRLVVAKISSQKKRNDYRAIGLTHAAIAEIRRCLLESGSDRV